jgi:hypothetical protein
MSLDWNLDNIEDWESVCKEADGSLSPVTNALIWATLAVDMGEITDDNAIEFAWRCSFYELFAGPLLVEVKDDDFVPRPLTIEDVRAHIGLTTNVVDRPKWTWTKKMVQIHRTDFFREVDRQKERT